MTHGLGRRPSPPDSRDYRLAAYLDGWPDFAKDMAVWGVGPTLDQGSSPHCVGFAGVGWMNAEPVPNVLTDSDGHDLYYECKAIDGDDEDGSYVRSAAKALKDRGRIGAYAFGSLLDARRFLLTSGPVVFGIDWTFGMSYPDADAVIHPECEVVGGHAILAVAADPDFCTLQNSWGKDWGRGGTCRISWPDLEFVFGEYGEAMAAVELPAGYVPEPVPWWVRVWRWIRHFVSPSTQNPVPTANKVQS